MKEKQQHLTLEGIKKFQDELDHLTQVRMEEIKVKLQEARAQGDLSENAEYDAAREEQAMVYERIQELQYILKNAVVIESDEGSDVITIGSTVTYRDDETNEELNALRRAKNSLCGECEKFDDCEQTALDMAKCLANLEED